MRGWVVGLLLVGACCDDDGVGVRVVGVQPLDDECAPSLDDPGLDRGALDLSYAREYVAHLRIARTAGGCERAGDDPIELAGAAFEVALSPGLRDRLTNLEDVDAAASWQTTWTLSIAPDGDAIVSLVLLPPHLIDALRAGIPPGDDGADLGTVVVSTTLWTAPSGDATAEPFAYAIRLCRGCLLGITGTCPDDPADPDHPASGPPVCAFGQDDLMPCCRQPDDTLACAPSPAPPDCTVVGCPAGYECTDCWGEYVCTDGSFVC